MTKDRWWFRVFSLKIVPKINKKSGFIDIKQKIPLLRNMFTQYCVMFQKIKWTPGAHFTNILREAFCNKSQIHKQLFCTCS